MTTPLVPDDLWDAIAPLLPPEPPKPKGGRPRVPDRAALGGILFVLRTGIGWEALPQELGCGSGTHGGGGAGKILKKIQAWLSIRRQGVRRL